MAARAKLKILFCPAEILEMQQFRIGTNLMLLLFQSVMKYNYYRRRSGWHFAILSVGVTTLMSACAMQRDAVDFSQGQWIDLTHAYESSTPYWPTASGFQLDTVFEGLTDKGYYYSAYSFKSAEHGGTHIDAPVHFAEGKESVDQIPISRLVGPAVVVDVSDSCSNYIDYQISVADLQHWETTHGEIEDGSILLFRTGLSDFWPDRKSYMGTAAQGESAVALLHFPGLHPDAAQWLVDHRNILALGLDTPSIDYGRSSQFLSHRILFAENIPAFENLAGLSMLPPRGAQIIALPMKIKGGSGGPLRIVAWLR